MAGEFGLRAYRAVLRNGPHAWPGGYPLFGVTSDGAALCFKCLREEEELITEAIAERLLDGWRVEAIDVNWEDGTLICDNCNERIESAYAEDESGEGAANGTV